MLSASYFCNIETLVREPLARKIAVVCPPHISPAMLTTTAVLPATPGSHASAPATTSCGSASNNSLPGTTSSSPPAPLSTLLQPPVILVCPPSTSSSAERPSFDVIEKTPRATTTTAGSSSSNGTGSGVSFEYIDNGDNSSISRSNDTSATTYSNCIESTLQQSLPALIISSSELSKSESLGSAQMPAFSVSSPATAIPTGASTSTSTSTLSTSPLSSSSGSESSGGPRVRRRGTANGMSLELYTQQPTQVFRLPAAAQDPTPAATLGQMLDCRFPAQAHDTTSIYVAAQRRQRLQKEKEPTRRSSTNVPPSKSCLSPNSSRSEPTSPTKVKRKVSFADDKGLSLTEVRVMKNEINELPRWTQQLLFQSLPTRNESTVINTWDPLFPQPASDYLAFRKRIEENNVALENVIVKKDDDLLTGTIKVKNLTFEKHVFVRATFDCWASYCNYPAIFVSQGTCPVPALFDTFSFSIKVPASAARYGIIELCVGYKTPHREYWDSNGGKNYKLASVTRRTSDNTSPVVAATQVGFIPPVHKLASYSTSDIAGWTDFSSWNQILSQGPYW